MLAAVQGSLSPSSDTMHPDKEAMGQNASKSPWRDEELLSKVRAKKKLQKVEMRTGGFGGMQ